MTFNSSVFSTTSSTNISKQSERTVGRRETIFTVLGSWNLEQHYCVLKFHWKSALMVKNVKDLQYIQRYATLWKLWLTNRQTDRQAEWCTEQLQNDDINFVCSRLYIQEHRPCTWISTCRQGLDWVSRYLQDGMLLFMCSQGQPTLVRYLLRYFNCSVEYVWYTLSLQPFRRP